MKILHVIPSLSPVRGGPSQAVLEMVQAQRHLGLDATIATTTDHGDGTLVLPSGPMPLATGDLPELVGPSVPAWIFPRLKLPSAGLRDFALAPTLLPWLLRTLPQMDVLHVHAIFNYPTTLAMTLAAGRVPYVLRPLGSLGNWALGQGTGKKQLYLRLGGRRLIMGSAALHFTSPSEQQEAQTAGFTSSSFVLPHGVALPDLQPDAPQRLRQRLAIPADQQVVLFLSRLHPKKGIEHLLDALALPTMQTSTLVVAGSGSADYTQRIRQRVQQLGIGDRVRLVGFATGTWKACLLQGADVFALPSYSENLGIAVLEAMAAGRPVVTTPQVALAPLIQRHQTGRITAATAEALAVALAAYADHPDAARQAGAWGRALVKRQFSWPRQAAQLHRHYQQLIAAPHLSPITP